jgi:hypothetical protein
MRLQVTASGVSILQTVNNLVWGASGIRGAQGLLLSSTGLLVDSQLLTLKASLGSSGVPCLDEPNRRAYLLDGNALRGFDTVTALPTDVLTLPFWASGDWGCIRWGLDGFAFFREGSDLHIARWSATIPPGVDSNADGFSDAWSSTHFNSLNVNSAGDDDGDSIPNFLEYVFGTSPVQPTANPMQVSAAMIAGKPALRVVFPRRADLRPQSWEFVVSSNLTQWATASGVTEKVLSSQSSDGVQMDTIETLIPGNDPASSFVRFKWLR